MEEKRKCTKCLKTRGIKDFYLSNGYPRRECKKCTIKRVSAHNRKTKPWKYRDTQTDEAKEYRQNYYYNNLDKFAQYRDSFKQKNPEYFKLYARERKDKKRGERC